MYSVRYRGKKGKSYSIAASNDLVVVRSHKRTPSLTAVSTRAAYEALDSCERVIQFASAGVEVFRVKAARGVKSLRDKTRKILKKDKALQFAGRVLCDPKSGQPVVYTENFFVKFEDDASTRKCKKIVKSYNLEVKRELSFTPNGFFVGAPEGTGTDVFDIAKSLLSEEIVELCHPELVREVPRRVAFSQQWHLKRTTVNGASVNAPRPRRERLGAQRRRRCRHRGDRRRLRRGPCRVRRQRGKIVSPRDVTRNVSDARPFFSNDDHGTACAGVACANGGDGASGVAPKARLMPIRLASGLGSMDEAEAFDWAVNHGADVISCSWGPRDGRWWDPGDPQHGVVAPLPDSTRLAIDNAVNNGRGGKGCVITWAAGNGNESVDNDHYASYGKVIAVGACSDRSKKSKYSDVGNALWCVFPSNDFAPPTPLTPGIWTVDRRGSSGYNPTETGGDAAGNYTDGFSGTSSACPGAAGVAALILARNPALRWDQVKTLMKQCAEKIDSAGGAYDAAGHSQLYGHGRLNARKAVELAAPAAAKYTARHTALQKVAVKDNATSRLRVAVGDTKSIVDIRIGVDIEHTYIGDLIVKLKPPSGSGSAVVLHNRTGGTTNNIKRQYDTLSTPALAGLVGATPAGTWTLEVTDRAARDQGNILSFTVELDL